jgi:hypothetical protein
MKRDRWLSGLLSAGVLSFSLATVGAQVAQAQRPINILDLTCVNRGSGQYQKVSEDISVGRELYTAVLRVWPNAAFTCRLPGGSASLRLEYGMSDTAVGMAPITITVYLDGNQLDSKTASPGQVGTLLVNVSGGKSLAIETACARATNCEATLRLFKAQIEPGTRSPGSK